MDDIIGADREADIADYKPTAYCTPPDGRMRGDQDGELGGDQDSTKAYPNGIRVTFAAIWQRWAFYDKAEKHVKTTAVQFSQIYSLLDIGKELSIRYPGALDSPGSKDKKIKSAQKKAGEEFWKIGKGDIRGLDYMRLRRAAEVVKLPLGLFLFFTNLVSQERRIGKKIKVGELAVTEKKSELLALISKFERTIAEARLIVEEADEDQDIFFKVYKEGEYITSSSAPPKEGEEVYFANLKSLKRMSDASRS